MGSPMGWLLMGHDLEWSHFHMGCAAVFPAGPRHGES